MTRPLSVEPTLASARCKCLPELNARYRCWGCPVLATEAVAA